MSQDNLASNEDRAKPRFQAPPVPGTSGNTSASARAAKNGPGDQPIISPATKQTQVAPEQFATGPARPTDWPSPDATSTPAYQPPSPSSGTYQAPAAPSYDWSKMSGEPKSDNLYRYENFSSAPYTPYTPAQPQPQDPQADAYRQASRRVRARLDFHKQLWSYLLVNGFLWIIYFMTFNPAHQSFWPVWITVFWGIGLFTQWRNLAGRDVDRQRRMVEEEMRRRNQY